MSTPSDPVLNKEEPQNDDKDKQIEEMKNYWLKKMQK